MCALIADIVGKGNSSNPGAGVLLAGLFFYFFWSIFFPNQKGGGKHKKGKRK